eukprot:s1762_g5.t1
MAHAAHAAHAEWDLWGRLEKIVQDGSYMSANEEFTALKGLVQKADASELSAQLPRAPLAWEFLLTFGAKKPFYRSHLCQVVEALLAQPRWREVYASSQELQEKAADPVLHADIKKALATVPAAPAAAAAAKKEEKPRAGPSKDVEWPSWEVLQEVVQKETFMAANEEFRVLRLAVLAADPVQLASQVAHAPMVWEFIAGFAAKKSHFRSQVVEVTSALRKERGWDEALEAAQPSLRSRINELPEAAAAVRGQLSRADQSPAASGGDSSLGDVGEEEHQTPYTSPDFRSLEERSAGVIGFVTRIHAVIPSHSLPKQKGVTHQRCRCFWPSFSQSAHRGPAGGANSRDMQVKEIFYCSLKTPVPPQPKHDVPPRCIDTAATRPVAFMTFRPAQGSRGENVGCVGSSAADVGPDYYEESYGCSSLDVCKTKCIYNVKCVGIEYSEGDDGRCRVWTRQEGIGGTVPLTNYVCLQYGHNLPSGEYCWSFLRVEGNGGPGTPDKYKCLETAELGDGRRLLM